MESNIIFRVQENQPEEIIRISSDGNIYWRGRLIEADQDFKDAMLDLRDQLMKINVFDKPEDPVDAITFMADATME